MSILIVCFSALIARVMTNPTTRISKEIVEIPLLPTEVVEYMSQDNMQRYKKVETKINDIGQKYDVDKYQPISAIINGMSSAVLDSAFSRQYLSLNGWYASVMPQFKPSGIKDGKQRELWDSVEAGCIQINSALLAMMDADTAFQGNFYRLHNSIQTALNYMDNGLDFGSSMNVVKKQLNQTTKMQTKFKIATDAFSNDAFQTISNIIRNSPGALEIQQQLKNRQQYYYEYTAEFEKHQVLEDERLKELQPIRSRLAEAQGRFEVAEFEFNNAKNDANDGKVRQKTITNSMDTLWDNFAEKDQEIEETHFRTETSSSGWWLWKKTHSKQIPYKVRVQNPERKRIKERIDIWTSNQKENDKYLKSAKEIKSKWKNKTEEAGNDVEIVAIELEKMEKKWNATLEKQAKKVDIAHNKWYKSFEIIQKAFNETGISEENIVELLKLVHILPERAMKMHQANKGMEELIESLYSFIEVDVGADDRLQSIKDHFGDLGANPNFERIYTAMSNEGMNIMTDLEIMDISEFEEIVKVIDAQLQSHNEKKLNYGEEKFLKRVIKGTFDQQQVRSKTFKTKFTLIIDFFKDMHGGLRVLKNELPFFPSIDIAKYIAIGMNDKEEL